MTEGIIWRTTEREVTRSVAESRGWARMDDKRNNYMTLVAMRLGETPVLIPNTMVKT